MVMFYYYYHYYYWTVVIYKPNSVSRELCVTFSPPSSPSENNLVLFKHKEKNICFK